MSDIFDQVSIATGATPKGDVFDFISPDSAVQNMNGTIGPLDTSLAHRLRISKLGQAVLGPEIQPAVGVRGALPNLSQIAFGNVKPDVSSGQGVLNFSPAAYYGEPQNEVDAVSKAVLSQMNLQNLGLAKMFGLLHAAPASVGVNLLKAGTGAALATQGAEGIGTGLGTRLSGAQLTPEQKGNADVDSALGALMTLAPLGMSGSEKNPNLQGVKIDRVFDLTKNKYVSGEMQQGSREFPFVQGAPSARFNVGPQGDVFDQITSGAQPAAEPLRSETVRPARAESVVIGAQPKGTQILTPEMLAQSPTTVLPVSQAMRAPVGDVGGQVSFRGEGVPSAMQAREMVPQPQEAEVQPVGEPPLKRMMWDKSLPVLGGSINYTDPQTSFTVEGFRPPQGEDLARQILQDKIAHDLVPAIKIGDRIIKATPNELNHDDILKANGMSIEDVPAFSSDRGFVDSTGKWFSRKQAANVTGLPTKVETGMLHSEDLPRAQVGTEVNANVAEVIPELKQQQKLHSGVPIFDPSLWNMSSEEVQRLKEKYTKKILEAGSTVATELTKASRNTVVLDTPRAQAILNNPNAKKFETLGKKFTQPGESLSALDTARNALKPIINKISEGDKVVNPWDVVFDWLDGGQAKFQGPLVQQIRIPFDEKFNAEGNMQEVLTAPLKEIVKKNNFTPKNEQRIAVYLHSLQEGGHERMIESGVRPDIIDNIVRTLSPAERAYADAWRKIDDQLYPQLADVAQRADGVKVKQVASHFPWMRDFDKYTPDVDEIATNPSLKKGGSYEPGDVLWPGLPLELGARKTPGSIISRKIGSKTPIRFDTFAIADRYIRDAAHYISSRELVKSTGKLVATDEFAEKYGDLGQKLMTEFLNTYARQGRYKKNLWIDTIKRNLGRAIIGGRIPSQFLHAANVPFAVQQAGPIWWERGLQETLSEKGQDFIHKHFIETKMRGGGEPVQTEIAQQSARTLVGKRYNDLSRWSFAVQREIDRLNAQATTLGVYMRLLKESGKDPNDYADIPVDSKLIGEARIRARRAVASPLYKDTPPVIARGGSLGRSFFQFQNVFLDQYSNLRYEGAQVGVPQAIRGNPKQLMTTTAALLGMLMIETGIKHAYKQGVKSISGQTSKKDDDTYTKELLQESLKRAPGMGQLQSSLLYGGTGVPVLDVPYETMREVKKAIQGDTPTRITAATRAAVDASELLGITGVSQLGDVVTAVERRQLFKPHEKRVSEFVGKNVSSMRLQDRIKAERDYKKTQAPMSKDDQAKAAERNIANITRRGNEITQTLDKSTQQWIKSKGLGDALPGFDNKLKVGGSTVYLTEDETSRLEGLVKQEYVKTIKQLQTQKSTISKDVFNEQLTFARARARAMMVKEISNGRSESESGSKNEQDNKNKKTSFSIIPRN